MSAKIKIEFFDREVLDYCCLFDVLEKHFAEKEQFVLSEKFKNLQSKFQKSLLEQSLPNRLETITKI